MRKVLRLFEEEKQEAVREAIARIERENTIEIAKSLLDILSPEMIAKKTGLDIEEVGKLRKMYIRLNRQELIKKAVELAKSIEEDKTQLQDIAGILTAKETFIDEEYAKKVREWLKMTKVVRIFEEEKQEAVEEKTIEIAKSLLDILSPEMIAKKTGLDVEEVERLKKC